jgi:hypothetical protein
MSDYDYKLMFNLSSAIGHADHRTASYGYPDDGRTSSVLRAAFVTWLVACEEARAQVRTNDPKASFVKYVVEALPNSDDLNWEQTNSEGFPSSLKNRMQGLWGIRIAFTHSDGDVSKIVNLKNKAWAQSAHLHVKGVSMSGNVIDMSGADLHYIHRSFAQLQTVLI